MVRPVIGNTDQLVQSASGLTLTIASFTVSSSDKSLIVFACRDDAGNSGFTHASATWNGNSMTRFLYPTPNMAAHPTGRYATSFYLDVTGLSGTGSIVVTQSGARGNNIVHAFTASGFVLSGHINSANDDKTWEGVAHPYNASNILLVSSFAQDNNTATTTSSSQTILESSTVSNIIVETGSKNAAGAIVSNEWDSVSSGHWAKHTYSIMDTKAGNGGGGGGAHLVENLLGDRA